MSHLPESGRAGRALRRLLWISVLLNLLLAGYLLRPRPLGPVGVPTNAPVSERSVESEARGRSPGRTPGARGEAEPDPIETARAGTIWSGLQSTNLPQFIANLRAVGCPEETICDLILPALGRQVEAAFETADQAGEFWATGSRRGELQAAARRARFAALDERDRVMALAGCPEPLEGMERWETGLLVELVMGFLPSPGHEQLPQLLARTRARVRKMQIARGPLETESDRAARRAELRQLRDEIKALIGPTALEEVELRASMIGGLIFGADEALGPLELSGAEFRAVCAVMTAGRADRIPGLDGLSLADEDEESVGPDDLHRQESLRPILGERRFAEYLQSNYQPVKESASWLKEAGADPAAALGVRQILKQWADELPQWRAQWAQDRDAQRAALEARRGEILRQMESQLGLTVTKERRAALEGWVDTVLSENWRSP